ncbi:Isoamyl acetate-hydrolyzing esterase 1-like protein, partial [Smittium culicis]
MQQYNNFEYDKFIAFGGSSTQWAWNTENSGWVAQLANAYSGKIDILNRGFAGYNTRWSKPIFSALFSQASSNVSHNPVGEYGNISTTGLDKVNPKAIKTRSKIRLVIIFLGVNDAADNLSTKQTSHVPLAEFSRNLNEMITLISEINNRNRDLSPSHNADQIKVLLITPPPVNEQQWLRFLQMKNPSSKLDRCNDTVRNYVNVVKQVGAQFDIPVVDIFTRLEEQVLSDKLSAASKMSVVTAAGKIFASSLEKIANLTRSKNESNCTSCGKTSAYFDGYEKFFYDGLHLNSLGNSILFEMVASSIQKNYPELAPSKIKSITPSAGRVANTIKSSESYKLVYPQ